MKVLSNCLYCGTLLHHYSSKPRKFCSRKCFGAYRSTTGQFAGNANPNWKPPIEKACAFCGAVMHLALWQTRGDKGRKYCSEPCRKQAKRQHWPKGTCLMCGEVFIVGPQRKGIFCSWACQRAHKRANKITHDRQCKQCGQEFTTASDGAARLYCSHSCYAASIIGTDKGGKVTLQCGVCGKHFTRLRGYIRSKQKRNPGGPLYCSQSCRKAAHKAFVNLPTVRAKQAAVGVRVHLQFQRDHGPTDIEAKMMQALDAAGISYTPQFPIVRRSTGQQIFVCDIAIPEARLIIECDGDYWHSLPETQKRDKHKNAYLKAAGYTVLRFTGSQIKQDIDACVQAVQAALSTAAAAAS